MNVALPGASAREKLPVRWPSVFGDGVVAGFSTRHGGISKDEFASLNLGLSTGDVEATVRNNRDVLFRSIGSDRSRLATAGQINGTHVAVATRPGLYPETDGLVSATSGLMLAITVADCAVVLLADERAIVIGACHAGWRGTAGRICSSAVSEMVSMGARPDRIRAYISPCISVSAFEVGEEVARHFDNRFVARRREWRRPHVDLKAALAYELFSNGIARDAIEIAPECTFDSSDFYSYRFSGGRTGRMMGFITLESPWGRTAGHQ